MTRRLLTRSEIRAFYDRMGKGLDRQFYEERPLRELIRHGGFRDAKRVFELGCGTGAMALELLTNHLPPDASYLGVEISPVMAEIAEQRLAPYKERARVILTDGSLRFDLPDSSLDRFIATYVLDILPPEDIKTVLSEAGRLLKVGGKLCLVSLTRGGTIPSKVLVRIWDLIHRARPALVGGCRPVELLDFIGVERWEMEFHGVITSLGVPSEMVVARVRK